VLSISAAQIRLFLHVVGACVWLGGQLVLAGIVPVVRAGGDAAVVRAVARRFQQLAWPAYAVLLGTGAWNLAAVHVGDQSSAWLATLLTKLVLVALAGICAALHSFVIGPSVAHAPDAATAARRRAASGATAGLALLFTLVAAFLGVQLGG
jgi:putative copper export protein